MHPVIEIFANQVKHYYRQEEDIPEVLSILKSNNASRVQAFITLTEGLGLSEDLIDKYILESNHWTIANDLTEDFYETCLYSSKL